VPNMRNTSTLLITASNDEHANQVENNLLFSLIASHHKQRIDFDSGHILPAHYIEHLVPVLNQSLKCLRHCQLNPTASAQPPRYVQFTDKH